MNDVILIEHLKNSSRKSRNDILETVLPARLDRCLLASLTNHFCGQSNVIETGTATGLTSLFILHELQETSGLLFSIDLPTSEKVTQIHQVPSFEIGRDIPSSYKKSFIQVIEDAKTALPRLLEKYECHLFVHDSLHTITHQMYEYIAARSFMPVGSIIASDDILWNRAFVDFVKIFELPFWVCETNPNFGITLNIPHNSERNYLWGEINLNSYIKAVH